jgi:uncharacterized glyoxalase superfamily protein PhnB
MDILRIVPNILSDNPQGSISFYTEFLGMELVMDMGWIITFASRTHPLAQISIVQSDDKPDNTAVFLSIEVTDVDLLHEQALRSGIPVVYPLTNEEWGVRRFFVKDPNGATINLLMHGRS